MPCLAYRRIGARSGQGPPRRKVIMEPRTPTAASTSAHVLLMLQSQDVEVPRRITIESGDGLARRRAWPPLARCWSSSGARMCRCSRVRPIPSSTAGGHAALGGDVRQGALQGRTGSGYWRYYVTVRPHRYAADVDTCPIGGRRGRRRSDAGVVAAEVSWCARCANSGRRGPPIVALGPFTNIALAAKLDESFASNCAKELAVSWRR